MAHADLAIVVLEFFILLLYYKYIADYFQMLQAFKSFIEFERYFSFKDFLKYAGG